MIDCGVGRQMSNGRRGEACDGLRVVCLLDMAGNLWRDSTRDTRRASPWRERLAGGVLQRDAFSQDRCAAGSGQQQWSRPGGRGGGGGGGCGGGGGGGGGGR